MFLRFVQISREERPRRGRRGPGQGRKDGHRTSGERGRGRVRRRGGLDRPLSESAPTSRTAGPTGLDPGGPFGVSRVAMSGENALRRTALLVLVASLIAGCSPDGPLGTVGALVTAPITAPVMFVSARMNDREDHLERARKNDRPMPPIDEQSRAMARATVEKALGLGRIDEGLYWQNDEDASGYAAGGVTVLAAGPTDDGRVCREVLIETAMERRPTDQRVRTYCRDGARWSMLESTRNEVQCRRRRWTPRRRTESSVGFRRVFLSARQPAPSLAPSARPAPGSTREDLLCTHASGPKRAFSRVRTPAFIRRETRSSSPRPSARACGSEGASRPGCPRRTRSAASHPRP